MERLIVIGGKRLKGTIRVSGGKNAILPILAASLLSEGTCLINEVPKLLDVSVMKEVLSHLNAKIQSEGNSLTIDGSEVKSLEIAEDLMRRMRASNLVMGPLLGRFGKVRVAHPGGYATIEIKLYILNVIVISKAGFIGEELYLTIRPAF